MKPRSFPFLFRRPLAFHTRSIAFRLILAVLVVELVSSILVVAISFGYERHSHFHAFDILMRGRADTIIGAVQDSGNGNDDVMLIQRDVHSPPNDVYEVLDEQGNVIARSANWQGVQPGPAPPPWGSYQDRRINDRDYRLVQVQGTRVVDPDRPGGGTVRNFTVIYGGRTHHVWEAIWGTVEFYAFGSTLLLFTTGPLIAWLLHRGLLPLRQLAALAAEVSVDSWQFDPPPNARLTPELAPLTHAVESVLQRLEQSFV
jgi:hypothetical protein